MANAEVNVKVNIQTAYGVWIDGRGWLKEPEHQRPFASFDRAVAEAAAALWGAGAVVLPVDNSLHDLEALFLEQQARAALEKPSARKWWQRWRT